MRPKTCVLCAVATRYRRFRSVCSMCPQHLCKGAPARVFTAGGVELRGENKKSSETISSIQKVRGHNRESVGVTRAALPLAAARCRSLQPMLTSLCCHHRRHAGHLHDSSVVMSTAARPVAELRSAAARPVAAVLMSTVRGGGHIPLRRWTTRHVCGADGAQSAVRRRRAWWCVSREDRCRRARVERR